MQLKLTSWPHSMKMKGIHFPELPRMISFGKALHSYPSMSIFKITCSASMVAWLRRILLSCICWFVLTMMQAGRYKPVLQPWWRNQRCTCGTPPCWLGRAKLDAVWSPRCWETLSSYVFLFIHGASDEETNLTALKNILTFLVELFRSKLVLR